MNKNTNIIVGNCIPVSVVKKFTPNITHESDILCRLQL